MMDASLNEGRKIGAKLGIETTEDRLLVGEGRKTDSIYMCSVRSASSLARK